MKYGALTARRKALEAVVRSFEPKLSVLVAIALTDRDQTIRALAAAASAQVSSNVTQELSDLEDRHGQAHAQAPRDMLELTLSLADHGCHNVLLPQTQRIYLCQVAEQYLTTIQGQMESADQRHARLASTLQAIGLQKSHFEVQAGPRRPLEILESPA